MYNYLCNQWLLPLKLWVKILFIEYSIQHYVIKWPLTGWWISPISSINKTDCHNITEILLKKELNTITFTPIIFMNHLYVLVILYKYMNLVASMLYKLAREKIIVQITTIEVPLFNFCIFGSHGPPWTC